MKLSDELYEIGKNSKKICTYIDENYVILTKTMPINDAHLDEYINSIRKSKDNGINISSILDYRLIEGTTSSYNNAVSYTKGVFLEERAKGKCISQFNITYLNLNENYDFNKIINDYLNQNETYLSELEERSNANQEIYDKLVNDCLKLNDFKLTIDPKPLNFFFDKDKGYNIIDVIPSDDNEITNEFFPKYIFNIVYGYARPSIIVNSSSIYSLPSEMHNRYKECMDKLNAKIVKALRNNNINEEFIKKSLLENSKRIVFDNNDMNQDEICIHLKEIFNQEKQEKDDEIYLKW